MRRTSGWRAWAWPARCVVVAFIVILVAYLATSPLGLGGLMERLLAAFGAATIGTFAWRISTRRRVGLASESSGDSEAVPES